jgi:hypothetical protein
VSRAGFAGSFKPLKRWSNTAKKTSANNGRPVGMTTYMNIDAAGPCVESVST